MTTCKRALPCNDVKHQQTISRHRPPSTPFSAICQFVQMTGVGVGDTQFEIEVFLKKYTLGYRCLPDPDNLFEEPFALRGTPTVLVFHRDSGKCVEIFRNEGRFRTSDIDKLLETVRKSVSP